MKRLLSVLAILVAALFLASCCLIHKGPCGHGPGSKMEKCAQCPKAADCKCKKDGKCLCKDGKCKDCPNAAGCQSKDGKCAKCGAACKCVKCGPGCACGCGCGAAAGAVDQKELQHGPCGAPEGAPAK